MMPPDNPEAHRRAEEPLPQNGEREEAAAQRVADILESISDAFFAVDEKWHFTYVNSRAEELWSRSREELLGKCIWDVFPEVVGSEFYNEVRRAAEKRETIAFETPSPVRGTWIAGRISPSRVGLSIYFQDVTGRRRTEEALVFLAEASEVLSSSLDYRTTLASVARLSVSTFADWCAVDIVADDGSLERLAVEHPDPEKIELAYKLEEHYPPDRDAPGGVHHAIRTGQSQTMSDIPAKLVEEAARDEEHREMLRKLGLRSYMVVPLAARGKTRGAITFVSHSGATRVLVNLKSERGDLLVEVSDDGQGYGQDTTPGVGLSSMRERATVIGGELEIESEVGRGTRVRLRVPPPREV